MPAPPEIAFDLDRLDRDVARAAAAVRRWRWDLARDVEAASAVDPLGGLRHVAGKSIFDVLAPPAEPPEKHGQGQQGGATPPPAPGGLILLATTALPPGDRALRHGLRRFVAWLTEVRLLRDLDVAIARATADPSAVVERAGASAAEAGPRAVSWNDAWRGVVTERARAAAIEHLEAAASRGTALAPLLAERAARRTEIARRLGLDDERSLFPAPARGAAGLARAVLDATEDLAADLLREARRRDESVAARAASSPVDAARVSLALDASEGWPAHLHPRWLHDLFGPAFAPALGDDVLAVAPDALPPAVGGASFARALETFGRTARRGAAARARSLPFAVRESPWFLDVYRVGAAFGALASSPALHRRALGTGERTARAQARSLGRTALFTLRLRAARALLASPFPPARDAWEEATARALGAPLPRSLFGAWPAPCDDESARFVGAATALPVARELVARFDEDWFRNPRAGAWLAARGAAAAHEDGDGEGERDRDPAELARTLARAFEEALG